MADVEDATGETRYPSALWDRGRRQRSRSARARRARDRLDEPDRSRLAVTQGNSDTDSFRFENLLLWQVQEHLQPQLYPP